MASSSNDVLPLNFLSGPAPPITLNRIDFNQTALTEYKGYYAVVLDNVLSPEECQTLVTAAEAQTSGLWEPAMVNAGSGTQKVVLMARNCGRIIWDSPEVVAKIWARIQDSVPELEVLQQWPNVTGNGPVKRGETWKMTQLNERMRFLRYGAGQYFREHCDGTYIAPNWERSFFTLHLYLNDSSSSSADGPLKGGATTFYSYNMTDRLDVEPKNGRALIFQHRNLLHAGDDVSSGIKLTMRTDIMYEHVEPEDEFSP
ncbi:MAG: hypothetical protein M1830_001110 [Pleopsidium flavum]|nr:MAG: hypothetical protein M1830_001110 [Pleopsidium flavum]